MYNTLSSHDWTKFYDKIWSPNKVGFYTGGITPKGLLKSDIKQVIYNNPATIVYFKDGSKVVVKTMEGDVYSKETGLAMALMKKMFGSSNAFKKFVEKGK